MDVVKVRSFAAKDAEAIHAISCECFKLPWSLDAISAELDNEFAMYFIAELGEKVVGFGGMWILLDEADITNIAVSPKFHGRKIGSAILSEMIQYCQEKDILNMTLEVRVSNKIAKGLYEKFGFINEGIRKKFYDDGEDAVIMWRKR